MLKDKRVKLTQINNTAGIQESFSVVYDPDKDEDVVKMTVGLNMLGNICKPYTLSQALGFITLADKLAISDVRTFIRSHKSLYFMSADSTVVCDAILHIDAKTRELKKYTKIKLYVARKIDGNELVCAPVTSNDIPQQSYYVLVNGFLNDLARYDLTTKANYFQTRSKGE